MAQRGDVRTGFIHGPEILASHKSRIAQAGFTIIPNGVMTRGDLRPGTKLVYGYLKHLAWREKAEAVSTLQEVIAADLHMSVETVRTMLQELQKAPLHEGDDPAGGTLIEAVRRGQGYPNVYLINDPPTAPETSRSRPGNFPGQDAENFPFPIESSSFREDSPTTKTSKQDGPRAVAGTRVTAEERITAAALLEEFNERAGTDYQASKWLVLIIRRLRESTLTYDDHRDVLRYALDHPWWRDRPSPSVVYGSEEQYERTVQQSRARTDGNTLTPEQIRSGSWRDEP